MDLLKRIPQFFKYWYVRYLLVTEMYMVEPWEKAVVFGLFTILFGVFWFFNYSIVLSAISHVRGYTAAWEEMM